MENELNYSREMQMTPEMNDVITDSFLHNPMFGINIFKSDRRRLSALMKLCLLYSFRYCIFIERQQQ